MFKRIVTLLFGIGLIALGILFFMAQERHFVVQILTQYWPFFLIIAGLVRVSGYLIDRHPSSPLGGMIITAIGGILLAANLRGEHSIVRIFGNYWFWLLLAFIIGRIVHQYTHRPDDGPRPTAFSPAAIILMILIAGSGLAANYLSRKMQLSPAINLGVANNLFGRQYSIEDDTPQIFALSSKTRLVIDGAPGDLEIAATQQQQASARIIKRIRALNEDEARKSVQNIHLQISHEGDQIRVIAPSGVPTDIATSIILALPEDIGIAVEVSNCGGSLKLNSLHGDYLIRKVEAVEASDLTGSIRVEGSRGDLELKRIRGAITLVDARSGSVSLEDIEGPVSIVAEGDVTVRDFLDQINIKTDNGTIKLSTNEKIGAGITAINDRGRIQIFIPDDSGFRLDAASNHGRVRVKGFNQFTLQRQERSNVFGYNLSSTAPNITLRATNGILVQSSGLVIASRDDDGRN
jgi:DUF4097 and DUF4098 domain-containing protein YvlB